MDKDYRAFVIDENNRICELEIYGTLDEIQRNYNIYYLTDMSGNVIIDNRK